MYYYRLHGLTIGSAFDLGIPAQPELPEEEINVTISLEKCPQQLANPLKEGLHFQADGSRLLLRAPFGISILAEMGTRICIDLAAQSEDAIRFAQLLVLGSGFAALFRQRSLLCLHACVVEIDGKAIAFLGQSGSGKSTIAQALTQGGANLLSDDTCVLDAFADGPLQVHQGPPLAKLWQDSLALLGLEPGSLEQVRPQINKYRLESTSPARLTSAPLCGFFLLSGAESTEPNFRLLEKSESLAALKRNDFRPQFITGPDQEITQFKGLTRLADTVPIRLLHRGTSGSPITLARELISFLRR